MQWGSNLRRFGLLFWECSKAKEEIWSHVTLWDKHQASQRLGLEPWLPLITWETLPKSLNHCLLTPSPAFLLFPQHPTSWKVLTLVQQKGSVSLLCTLSGWEINGGELLTNQAKQSLSLHVLLLESHPSIHPPASSKRDLKNFKESSSLRQARKTGSSGIVPGHVVSSWQPPGELWSPGCLAWVLLLFPVLPEDSLTAQYRDSPL